MGSFVTQVKGKNKHMLKLPLLGLRTKTLYFTGNLQVNALFFTKKLGFLLFSCMLAYRKYTSRRNSEKRKCYIQVLGSCFLKHFIIYFLFRCIPFLSICCFLPLCKEVIVVLLWYC